MPDLADLYPGYETRWITTKPTAPRGRRSSVRCSRCGARPAFRPVPSMARWRRGSNGPKTCVGLAIDCGHYIPEECPDPVSKALIGFFK